MINFTRLRDRQLVTRDIELCTAQRLGVVAVGYASDPRNNPLLSDTHMAQRKRTPAIFVRQRPIGGNSGRIVCVRLDHNLATDTMGGGNMAKQHSGVRAIGHRYQGRYIGFATVC